jgi:hypothetical protein
MSEPEPVRDNARWDDDGGPDEDGLRARFVAEVARARPDELGILWRRAVDDFGPDEASHIWQDALAASDVTDT